MFAVCCYFWEISQQLMRPHPKWQHFRLTRQPGLAMFMLLSFAAGLFFTLTHLPSRRDK